MLKRFWKLRSVPPQQCREFRPGDEVEICNLWSRTHAHLSWCFVRDAKYWKWVVFDRGGAPPQNVLLIFEGPTLVAYGAMNATGAILDMAVETRRSRSWRRATTEALIVALERVARESGCHEICCDIPPSDLQMWRVLRKRGYFSDSVGTMSIGIGDPVALLNALLPAREPCREFADSAIRFEIAPGYYKGNEHLVLEVNGKTVSRCPVQQQGGVHRPATIAIHIDMTSLTDLLFNNVAVEALLQTRKVVVKPSGAAPAVARWLSSLAFRGAHFFPASEVF